MLNTMARCAQASVNQTCSACTKTDGRVGGGGGERGGAQVIHLGTRPSGIFNIQHDRSQARMRVCVCIGKPCKQVLLHAAADSTPDSAFDGACMLLQCKQHEPSSAIPFLHD